MKKVLWIEDEIGYVSARGGRALEEEGYEVIFAENGRLGIEMAHSVRPDIILLDVMLPDMNGFEVCHSLKSNDEYKSIPIIIMTALDDEENTVKGLTAGADDYVSKAPNLAEFLARIKSHLKMKELYDTVKSEEEEKSVLLDVSKSLSATVDPHETLYTICIKIAEVIEVKRCSIIYVNPLKKEAYVMASHDSRDIKHLEINLDKYPEIQKVIETGKAVVINDAYNDPILFPVREALNMIDIKSIMAFPITFKDTFIGTLVLRTSRKELPFNDREIRFCEVISNLAASPLKNSYLFNILHEEKEQEKGKRIAAEENNRTSRELFETTIEASTLPICVFDKQGNITNVNESYLKEWASGLARDNVIGTNIFKNTANNGYLSFYKKILIGERIKDDIDSEPAANTEIRTHIFHGVPIFGAEKNIIGGLFITDDITKHKQLQENLKEKSYILEKFHKVTVGRELDMIKLKEEVNVLLEKSGQPKKYEV